MSSVNDCIKFDLDIKFTTISINSSMECNTKSTKPF